MRAAYFYGKEDIRIKECQLNGLKDDEILVRVKACGICGTDIHIYHGSPGSAQVKPPVVLGHEYSGQVVEVGNKVSQIKVGDRIAVDPNMFCGNCFYCRSDERHLCSHLTALGVNMNGGFAEYCIVPASQAYKFSDNIDYKEAAMVEPLACCLRGIDRAGIKAGQSVAIVGGGAIGILMLQLALLQGAGCVVVSEPMSSRRNMALKLGADGVIDPLNEDAGKAIRSKLPQGADVVIECAGHPSAMVQAVDMARRGGTVVLFSVASPDAVLPLKPFDVFQKELTIKGSFINPGTHGRALALIASGKVKIKPLITHTYNLDELEKAIEMQTGPQSVKVMVTP